MNFFEIFQIFSSSIWIYGGSFIVILSLLVFIHEWGHYIVARLCGVKVEQFSIGFGKEIAGFEDKNGTRWKISLIPLGGYVKLYGDTDPASYAHNDTVKDGEKPRKMTKKEREVAFFAKPVWQRALVVAAGPGINYLFAILILGLMFTFNGQPITPPSAAAIFVGSSADEHGFEPHDLIVSIDGKKISSFEDVRREMMIALDDEKHFVVDRDGEIIDIYAKPEKIETEDRFGFKQSKGLLGLMSPRHAVSIKSIVRIDDKKFETPEGEEPDVDAIREELSKRMDSVFEIEIASGPSKKVDSITIHPLTEFNADFKDPESPDYEMLFVSDIAGNTFAKYPIHVSFAKAAKESWVITRGTIEALGQMVMGTRSAAELGGVIRIGAFAGDVAKQGIVALVLFTALLSINLGLINLFPIPLLDGGHLVFYAFEALLGKPIPDHIQEYAFRFGLVFLVGIMVFANLNDILQLFL